MGVDVLTVLWAGVIKREDESLDWPFANTDVFSNANFDALVGEGA
jgi:hypothetical protein